MHGVTRKAAHHALSIVPQTNVDLDRDEEMARSIKGFAFMELLNLPKYHRTVKIGARVRILGKGMKERKHVNDAHHCRKQKRDPAGG